MATANVNQTLRTDTDANYRTDILAIDTQVIAMGWVRTADTGQVNFATVLRPTVANTEMGYSMYRMNDALQATVPVFMRLSWTGGQAASQWGLNCHVGFATNGAGIITGAQQSMNLRICGRVNLVVNDNVSLANILYSGSSSRFLMSLGMTGLGAGTSYQQQTAGLISIERSKDNAGVDNSDGVIINFLRSTYRTDNTPSPSGGGPAFGHYCLFLPFSGGVPNNEAVITAIGSSNASSAFGAIGPTLGLAIPLAGVPKNPGLNLLVHHANDFTIATEHSITMYDGNAHNYRILGDYPQAIVYSFLASLASTPIGNNGRLAIRFE